MIKIAVVEDEIEMTNQLLKYVKQFFDENDLDYSVTTFDNAIKLLDNYDFSFDLIFMDINMPLLDGMSASKKLREIDSEVTLIFITSLAQYAINGYEVNAFDFIVKPVNYYKLSMKIDRAMVNLKAKKKSQQKKMLIKTIKENITISPSEIYYIEVMGHSLIYHTTYGNYEVYGTMNKASKELENEQFEFCNRCYFVNLAHVNSVKGYECKVGNDIIQISHLKKKNFMEKLNNYFVFGDKK